MTTGTSRLATALVVLGTTAAALFVLLGSREPTFEGRRLGLWLKDLDNWDGSPSAPAIRAVQAIGTNGIPCLLRHVAARDSRLTRYLCRQPSFVHFAWLVHLHLDPQAGAMKQQRAIIAFSVLREKGEPAIPALTRLLRKPETASAAAFALAHIGPRTMPILAQAATNSNSRVRSSAVHAFYVFGPRADVEIPLLTNALKDQDYYVRACSAWTLGHLGRGKRGDVIPPLIHAMTDPHPNVRAKAAEAFGTLGESSEEVLSVLRGALNDTNGSVRRYATNSLQQLTGSQS